MLFWAGAIAATLAYWPLVRRPPSVWRSVLKTLSVACLAAGAGQGGRPLLARARAFFALGG
ncbi:MAG: lysoplasmalogenase, partial [Aestuariivita sp.]|nr:lysoplasmalogenase [Aestuariivita sp.]